jgi:hypothetical protein
VDPSFEQAFKRPREFRLSQNAPNPFNPQTTITYEVPQTCTVRLSIHSLTGQCIRTLVAGEHSIGTYSVIWNGTDHTGHNVASGVYVCRMIAGSFCATRKLSLIR